MSDTNAPSLRPLSGGAHGSDGSETVRQWRRLEKKSAEESESLYVGSSALSSGAPYLIATSLSSSIIVYINDNNY